VPRRDGERAIVPSAMPLTIRAMAHSNVGPIGSPRTMAALSVPTTGVASSPSEVVAAGRLLLTMAMAQ
jgi:hypothetical protein